MGIKIFSPLSYSEGKLYGLSPSTPSATTLDLTFARNSTNRTRVSNRGVVQDVPYNLLSFSEEFDNTAWTKTQSTVTPNAVQPPNNPNYTADLVYPTGSTAFVQTSGTTTTASGGTYYFSVYARAAGKNFIMLNGSGGTTGVWYNLSTGVIGTQSAGNGYILNMGNGWYYCVWFGNLTGALQPIIRISDADNSTSNTASGTNGVFLWGAQLSQSTAVQPYFKTTNRLNVPAIDYSLSTGGSGCLLMEPQRTNLLLNSGTLSTQSVTVSAVQHTLSFYGTGTTALSGAFTGGLTGTTATGRVSLTFTPTAGTLTLTVTGVITNAQLEVGAYPTSYIPTTAASATRLADSFTRNSLFSNNYVTAAGGTWFVDLDNNIALARDAADVGLFLGDTATGTTNSFCINTPSGSSRMEIDSYVNGSATTLHVTTTDRTRAAIKWNGSTADVFVNGSKVVSGTTFTGTTLEYMGLNVRDTPKYIRGMWLAPVPLTDADLISATQPPSIVTSGLVLHLDAANPFSYPGLGTTWNDLSGFGNNGTLTNGPTFNPANGGSIQFDGVDDYVNCGLLGNFGSTMSSNGVSVEFIFNSTYTSDFKQFGIINDGTNTLLIINFNRDQSDNYVAKKTSFSIRGDGGIYLLGAIDTDIYTGKNFHVCATRQANTNQIKFYVNGVLQTTIYGGNTGNPTTFSNFQYPFLIGAANIRGIVSRHLNCNIPLFRLYNRALSDTEILQNYNATKSRFEVPALLDLYPNAAAAYSLRKLRSGYTGSAIRVRRSSDNTEQDIGFTSTGDLDTTALTTFVGANNGFVTTWYDQSGSGNNFIQTGTTNQPLIVNTGSLLLDKSKPIISFDGVNQFLVGGVNTSQQGTIFAIFNPLNDGAFRISQADPNSLLSSFSVDTLYTSPSTTNVRFLELLSPNNIVVGNTNINNSKILSVYNSDNVVWSAWVNSNSQSFTVTSGVNSGSWFGDYPYPMYLQRLNRSTPFNNKANVQEIIIYNTNQSTNRPLIESNINSYYGIYNQTADLDAQAFITAAAITDSTQQLAVNTLVKDLKSFGIWTKMQAIYPFVGGTANSHKFNLKDPRDVDGAFRLVFNGSWTHSATGALPISASNAWANTYLTPSSSLNLNSVHLSSYIRNSSFSVLLGADSSTGKLWIAPIYDATRKYFELNTSSSSPLSPVNSNTGFWLAIRNNATNIRVFNQNLLEGQYSRASGGLPNIPIYLAARNASNTAINYSNSEIAFATIGDGLTDTEAANLYTAVQKYQTTLGRQV